MPGAAPREAGGHCLRTSRVLRLWAFTHVRYFAICEPLNETSRFSVGSQVVLTLNSGCLADFSRSDYRRVFFYWPERWVVRWGPIPFHQCAFITYRPSVRLWGSSRGADPLSCAPFWKTLSHKNKTAPSILEFQRNTSSVMMRRKPVEKLSSLCRSFSLMGRHGGACIFFPVSDL